MADPAEMMRAAFEARTGGTPTSVTALVASMGGTKAAAALLGVTQRSVQRYVKSEAGKGGETRRASATQKTILGDAVRKGQAQELRQQSEGPGGGKPVKFAGELDIMGNEQYRGYRDSDVESDELPDEFWDALGAGEWGEAANLIADTYVPGSTMYDVDELEM